MIEENCENELKDFEEFEVDLLLDYDIEADAFWKAQHTLYKTGYRGIELHETTVIIMEKS